MAWIMSVLLSKKLSVASHFYLSGYAQHQLLNGRAFRKCNIIGQWGDWPPHPYSLLDLPNLIILIDLLYYVNCIMIAIREQCTIHQKGIQHKDGVTPWILPVSGHNLGNTHPHRRHFTPWLTDVVSSWKHLRSSNTSMRYIVKYSPVWCHLPQSFIF